MATIPYWQAKNLLAIDPHTSSLIEHVKASDPVAGWLEVWCTYPNVPGHESVWTKSDGTVEERSYMLLSMRDMYDGRQTYMSRIRYCDYDLIDKNSGEVIYESQYSPSPTDDKEDDKEDYSVESAFNQ